MMAWSAIAATAGQIIERGVTSKVRGSAGGVLGRLGRGLATGDPGAIDQAIRSGNLALQDAAVSRLARANGPAAAVLGAILSDIRRGGFATPAMKTPAPMWGGLDVEGAKRLHEEMARQQLARKNLFHVAVFDSNPPAGCEQTPGLFNLFGIDCSLSPCTMPGESVPLGSASMDRVTSAERVELRMTVMDDETGSIKRWFNGKCGQIANSDGTFGLPIDYVVGISIHHMDVLAERARGQFIQSFLMRCNNMDTELSRREQALEEITLTFTQFDTFMPAL